MLHFDVIDYKVSNYLKYQSQYLISIATYTMFPNGQLWGKAYAVAENGTQKIMNSRSATARFIISRLVVFRICLLKVTTNTTRRFPTKPTKTMFTSNEKSIKTYETYETDGHKP